MLVAARSHLLSSDLAATLEVPNRLVRRSVGVPRLKRKKLRGGQPGRRPLRMSEIPVVDAHGDRGKVYAREFRQPVPFTHVDKKVVAFELSTGERVQLVDEDTFKSMTTGAMFFRVAD